MGTHTQTAGHKKRKAITIIDLIEAYTIKGYISTEKRIK
jgi:hypothetical protein